MNYVVDALDRHGIPYAVTGSHASSVFGENRFTNDIDVVIQLNSQERLKQFLTEFPEGTFYVSGAGARHAVSHTGQFKIIHEDSSQKVDLIIPEQINWPDQFARRMKVATEASREIWFVSPTQLTLQHGRKNSGFVKYGRKYFRRAKNKILQHWHPARGFRTRKQA